MAITPTAYRRLVGGVWTPASMHYLVGGSWQAHGTTPITADFAKSAGAALAATPKSDSTPPTQPGTPSVSGGVGQATVTWTQSTDNVGVTGYQIYRDTSSTFVPPGQGTLAGTSTTTSFLNSGIAAGTYYYRVRAYDAAGLYSQPSAVSNAAVVTAGTFTDGRDITPQNVGLAGAGMTEADLTTYNGPSTLTSGTYENYLFLEQITINGPVTIRHCKWKTQHDLLTGGDAAASLIIDGDGTGRALIEWCDFTCAFITGVWPTGVPSQDRTVLASGNQPFTIQYCYIHDNFRGILVPTVGISALYPRIMQWNMIGNMWGALQYHSSCFGVSAGSAWWVELRGNRMLNNSPNGDASGIMQIYSMGGIEDQYYVIEKNYFEGTSAGWSTSITDSPTSTPISHFTVRDNWYGMDPHPQYGFAANSADDPFAGADPGPNQYGNIWTNNRIYAPDGETWLDYPYGTTWSDGMIVGG